MTIHDSVLELIGNTPMVRARHLDTGPCELFLKLELNNPGGSIKDRIGLYMIEAAEREGRIAPGATLVEGTAGNTGLGLALAAQQKGYRLVLVVPDKMSREKIFNLKAMGAEVRLTRSDVGKGHPEYYLDLAERIARETPGAYYINQFGNPNNPLAHETVTGPEIWEQMGHDMDAIVFGVGSVGHRHRAVAVLRPRRAAGRAGARRSAGLDPHRPRQRWPGARHGGLVDGGGHRVEDFVPAIADLSRVTRAYQVSDKDSFLAGRELLMKEGVLGGSSSGTIIAAALRYCRDQTTPKKVVAFVCDTGNKYLSKMYNDYWMLDNGYLERERYGDLRDLILRPYSQRDTVVVKPDDLLLVAYQRMKLYDVSQLPVMDGERLVGILDESDVLMHVFGNESRFRDPVSTAMMAKLDLIDVKRPLAELIPLFDRGHVAIVMDGERFLGLITRIDLLNYLRRRVS